MCIVKDANKDALKTEYMTNHKICFFVRHRPVSKKAKVPHVKLISSPKIKFCAFALDKTQIQEGSKPYNGIVANFCDIIIKTHETIKKENIILFLCFNCLIIIYFKFFARI